MPHYETKPIDGVPPKKDGSKSMWSKPEEVPRLAALRREVRRVMGVHGPLATNIEIRLNVHVKTICQGDLDNYVGGICDGLMRANGDVNLASIWHSTEYADIYPSKSVGIIDDKCVLSISAKKWVDAPVEWYSLVLIGEQL